MPKPPPSDFHATTARRAAMQDRHGEHGGGAGAELLAEARALNAPPRKPPAPPRAAAPAPAEPAAPPAPARAEPPPVPPLGRPLQSEMPAVVIDCDSIAERDQLVDVLTWLSEVEPGENSAARLITMLGRARAVHAAGPP